jgi:NAD(P)H-hydrate epimerase
MHKEVSVEQMRAIDAKAVSLGMPVYLMMENAGNALARYMLQGLGDLHGKKVVAVCGLSNNGGGGFAAARHLAYYGADVSVILLGKSEQVKGLDARLQWKTIEKVESIQKVIVENKKDIDGMKHFIQNSDGIVDAIFGTGLAGKAIRDPAGSAIDFINSARGYVISNDVPSGTNADTVMIPDKSVQPDVIVVLHRMKAGLAKQKDAVVVSIGIPPDADNK